jgi:hypothetical protein
LFLPQISTKAKAQKQKHKNTKAQKLKIKNFKEHFFYYQTQKKIEFLSQ